MNKSSKTNEEKDKDKDIVIIKKILLKLHDNDFVFYDIVNKMFYIMIIHMFISIFNIYFIYLTLINR